MLSPVFYPIRNFYIYLLVWGIISITHTMLLLLNFSFPCYLAIAEAVIFNLLFAALGAGLWHTIRFLKFDNSATSSVLLNHFVAACLIISIWISAGICLLNLIGYNQPEYKDYLIKSIPFRFMIGLLFYAVTILIFYLFHYYESFKKNLVKTAEMDLLFKETQLELLKSQLNPHFIFNALNSVSALTVSSPEKAHEMVLRLSSFLRYSLGQKNRLVPLKEELENCRIYLEIEKVRFAERLIFDITADEKTSEVKVPDLIFQPLIENAVKHGVYESSDQIVIRVSAALTDGLCSISILNTFDPDARVRSGKGLGLKNVKERLTILYGSGNWMDVDKTDHAFLVTIKVPLQ